MWAFICERLFLAHRAVRLFACLNLTAESTMMLCNNHAESFHSKLKRSAFYKTLRNKNMAEALKLLRGVHLDIQGSCAVALARFSGHTKLRKWLVFPLPMAFVGFLELLHASDYLIEELAAMMWYAEESGRTRTLSLTCAARSPSPTVSPASVEALQDSVVRLGATNLKVVSEEVLREASAILSDAGAYRVFNVTCDKAGTATLAPARKQYHVSSTVAAGTHCDCWFSCGKKLLCCHAFFVIRTVLQEAAATLDVQVNHAALSYLLYTWLNPTLTVWFGNRAPN